MSRQPDQALAATPVTSLRGVGAQVAQRLAKLGLETFQDLLFHLPARYQDRTRVVPLGSLRHGMTVVVEVEVLLAEVKFGRRRSLMVRVGDGTGMLTLRFFHFSGAQKASLSKGTRLRCFGEVRNGPNSLEMVHPEYRLLGAQTENSVEEHLTPIYPVTEGITQPRMRSWIEAAVTRLEKQLADDGNAAVVEELIPAALVPDLGFPSLGDALLYLHRPPPDADLGLLMDGEHPAQRRLAFEELLAHQLSLRLVRERSDRQAGIALRSKGELVGRLLDSLPFSLTGAQRRVCEEVWADLKQPKPMQRLVQGDVGSGKTLVAAVCALHAMESGYQVAVMAPTEILAEQHLLNFSRWLAPMGIETAWLAGKQRAAERRAALSAIAGGSARLAVGTQALFQDGVEFDDLALVIIDEQHRFGVHQRLQLREKGANDGRYPHQLIMTATPIPRTLAMTSYADLDVSVIDELPPGRTPVKTVVLSSERRDDIVERIRHACADGRQVYWVCTLIEESENLQAQAASDTAEQLAEALPGIEVGLVHGRLKADEKAAVMQRFKDAEIALLVATTVIEVGVDVPNASLMIIENAERLGLAQLHQLRGRVGRGTTASSCVLLYQTPLSQSARSRLAVMRESNDGFRIAEEDLKIRGPGEVLGTRQTGEVGMRIADLLRDGDLLPEVKRVALRLAREPQYGDGVDKLIRRWIGQATRYGDV